MSIGAYIMCRVYYRVSVKIAHL